MLFFTEKVRLKKQNIQTKYYTDTKFFEVVLYFWSAFDLGKDIALLAMVSKVMCKKFLDVCDRARSRSQEFKLLIAASLNTWQKLLRKISFSYFDTSFKIDLKSQNPSGLTPFFASEFIIKFYLQWTLQIKQQQLHYKSF